MQIIECNYMMSPFASRLLRSRVSTEIYDFLKDVGEMKFTIYFALINILNTYLRYLL
jgi:hypothetical protein